MGCNNDRNKGKNSSYNNNNLKVNNSKNNTYASKDIEAKVCLLGDISVGKTSIASRFCQDHFSETYINTIGGAYQQKILEMEDTTKVKLHIWDTSGQDRFRAMTSLYYRDAQAAILVYDVGNNGSFENIKFWLNELTDKVDKDTMKIYLAGNKCDLPQEKRVISEEKAKNFANENNLKFFETSAKTGEGVSALFNEIAKDQYLKHKNYREYNNEGC